MEYQFSIPSDAFSQLERGQVQDSIACLNQLEVRVTKFEPDYAHFQEEKALQSLSQVLN
jgi:hypothetical protein